jgi:type VI secretion system protein ImpL
MRFIKSFFGFFISRTFWTILGLVLLSALIWLYGPLLAFGTATPLASEIARLVLIALIVIFWLVTMLVRQIRAARANRMFVTDLARPAPERPRAPGEENLAEVNKKFQDVLDQMKRSKLGGRKFLRDMPWYVIIGPPGTGKTTALKQSGLHFPVDLSDDLKGVGGTRNCDWFFTEEAVLVDTAGRYVQQESDPEVDAAEWRGFLALLTKHRGRRALNGVILTLSVEELLGDETALRAHGREIRKRLAELREKLAINLPVYLMITKTDLIPGFDAFFGDLGTRAREQVWGATLPTDGRLDGTVIDREMKALLAALEERLTRRMADDLALPQRGEVFRFPAEVDRITQPLKVLIDTVFGESRYEESAWLRGFYLTSATQEGSPIDRLVGGMAASFGLDAPRREARRHGEKRSFFLRAMLTDVIFPEAGLGTFDPRAEERRRWLWRGTAAGAALATVVAATFFLLSFQRWSGGIADQERQFTQLSARLANVAARQAPTDPLDLPLALDAMTEVSRAATEVRTGAMTMFGPSAAAELSFAQGQASDRILRNVLEPRMVALLEATMWRQIRDPEFLLGALKTYQMMTGLAAYDTAFVADWWLTQLPAAAPIDPFPTEAAADHQLAAIERMAREEARIEPDPALIAQSLEIVCTIPLAVRAYRSLMAEPDVTGLPEWLPADYAGPNGTRVFTRISERTLRVGLPGAFTFDGFHTAILPLVPEVAAEAALDRTVFAGGCAESAEISVGALEGDILKLYYEDFIAQWDGLLRDIRLAPIDDLNTASLNLRDLSSADSALARLLRAVVAETHLTREPDSGASEAGDAAGAGLLRIAQRKLGKIGKLAAKSADFVPTGGGPAGEPPGTPVATHFAPIRGTVEEIDGIPPLLGDVQLALTALSNQLQTVLASPNPQQALLQQGGLPELTGAVANVAAALPDPVDDWIGGIAGDTLGVTRDAVIAQLNARWRADILPFCTSAVQGRYPFDEASAIDVNTLDFARLFGPGGLIDGFTNDHLLPYIDNTVRPWRWRADFGLDNAALAPFERAREIRDALFPGGAGPVMAFTLEPKDLSANAARVTLNVDGQNLSYFNSATRPFPMTWPGTDGTGMITLSFTPVDGSAEIITSEIGGWGLLRMIRKGRLSATALPEVFSLRLGAQSYVADFELRANSVINPFDLTIFSGFRCPQGF